MIKFMIKKIAQIVWLEANVIYDYVRFKRFYKRATSQRSEQKTLASWILQDKHRLEKAFSLPAPRIGFGEGVILRLCKNLLIFREKYGKEEVYYIGVGALKAYGKYHRDNKENVPLFYTETVQKFSDDLENPTCDQAGYFEEKATHDDVTNLGFKKFSHSRNSCRHYDLEKSVAIDKDELDEIMSIAVTAPSVCNRQHWKVHFFTGEKMQNILKYQNGNSGFNKNIPWLALVTSDVRAFCSPDERNQPYVDGGIFAMNLMYAIQAVGMSSCPLNWCNPFFKDYSFRRLGYIPENEVVIVAVAFGYPYENASYAKSPRLSLSNFYNIH